MNKLTLRKRSLALRQQIPPAHHKRLCEATTKHILQCLSQRPPQHLHIFLPMPQYAEWDSWTLLFQLWRADKPPTTWTTQLHKKQLRHASFDANTAFQLNKWGFSEPYTEQNLSHSQLAQLPNLTVLVPLLAFDRKGHRIGYGKGCYDTLIAQLPQNTPKIGVALTTPIESIPNIHPKDQPLTCCCTPTQIYHFQ